MKNGQTAGESRRSERRCGLSVNCRRLLVDGHNAFAWHEKISKMDFKEKEKEATTLVCSTCGKPLGGKSRTNVTRFLFKESRCTCSTWNAPELTESLAGEAGTGQQVYFGTEAEEPDRSIADNLGDRYEVLSLLGKGGMGAVYKVRDKELNKIFAVKVLNQNLVEDKGSMKRFEQEAKAASGLTHANMAAVYDFGMGKRGCPYLIMDYLEGTSLADTIKAEGYLDAPRAIDVFIQALEAVVHAHMKGVIHRDIKPSNIILEKKAGGVEFAKLVDFGIAKVLPSDQRAAENLTQTGDIFGSPLYMSPEQCQGNKQDFRSDIYAFGCVMYEALTGIQPFAAENPIRTILKHINEQPEAISSLPQDFRIPRELDFIVMRCLEKDPKDRYQTAQDLLKDLNALKEGKNAQVKIPQRKKKKRQVSRVARFAWAGAFAIVIGAASAVISVYFSGQLPGTPSLSGTTPFSDAQSFDQKSYTYFVRGQYDKALPLLEFGVQVYKEKIEEDSKSGDMRQLAADEALLAENYQHIGKCYLMIALKAEKENKPAFAHENVKKAVPPFKEALKFYAKYNNYVGMMPELVSDYSQVLNRLGMTEELEALRKDALRRGIRI